MKSSNLLACFEPDSPWSPDQSATAKAQSSAIEGVSVRRLVPHHDTRGYLTELLTTRDNAPEPIVHVYQVHAEPGSIRGWVYHRWQDDRLSYTEGRFRLALYDLREDSPSFRQLVVLDLGRDNPAHVTIPRLVAHALKNTGPTRASFVNMPTRAYDPAKPDKARLPYPDPRIPFEF